MHNFIIEIEILKVLREWEEIDLILKRDLTGYEVASLNISAAKAGEKLTVPLWVAKVLIERNIAFTDTEDVIDWINRVYWREVVQKRGTYNISKLPEDFYARINLILFILDMLRREEKYDVIEILRKSLEKLREIVNKRRNAIPLLSEIENTELTERLTFEEKVLLRIFKRIIFTWRNYVGV